MDLRIRLGSVALLVLVACGAPGPEAVQVDARGKSELDERLEFAARSVARRGFDDARAALDQIDEEASDDPRALIVHACLAIETGNLQRASEVVAELSREAPGVPESRLLEELVRVRSSAQPPGSLESFRIAWNAAGRPNLQDSALLIHDFDFERYANELACASKNARTPREKLLTTLTQSRERDMDPITSQLSQLRDPGLAMVAAHFLLPFEPKNEDTDLIAHAVGLARRVALEHPEVMQFQLIALVGGTARNAPLTTAQIDELERISSLPLARLPFLEALYADLRRELEPLGAGDAAWPTALNALLTDELFILAKRSEATETKLGEQEKKRLGRALWDIGAAAFDLETIVEKMVATEAMRVGARLMVDPERQAEARTRTDGLRETLNAVNALAMQKWPLPSVHDELLAGYVANEYATMQALVRQP